ncbi:glycosyl hydrolase, BNR repeat-containing protein [candidate division TM7 genomosp. GTL1]|nr:glycosyl hydrolase, BNR repeat-containing protein [candidate division TM7 genomosp. GTL1]
MLIASRLSLAWWPQRAWRIVGLGIRGSLVFGKRLPVPRCHQLFIRLPYVIWNFLRNLKLFGWFVWQSGSEYIYALDKASGVYRSNDYGANWTQIWATTTDVGKTGFIAQNPNVPTELWVSKSDGLYKLSNVQSGTVGSGITSAQITGVTTPGALVVTSDGTLYCIDLPTASAPVKLMRSTDGGVSWQDVSDEAFKAMATRPAQLAVNQNGRLYVSTLQNGSLIGYNLSPQMVG